MVLKPEDIEQSDFATSRRGYDKDEVRAYLRDVAGQVRDLQERDPADEATSYLPVGDTSDISAEDRFGALGDRIATLLREAHDASEQTRETAANDAEALRTVAETELDDARTTAARELEEARSEAERVRQDADAYRLQVDEEAIQIRDQAEIDGNARLDERRTLIEEQEVEIAAERETAMAELSDARAQVASLLQEARAQSEFIKREAEEIIRAKVRANMDKAQRRIDILRTTEESSKDRILTAQRELESALTRLEAEPLPEFPADTEDAVVLEAEGRVAEAELAEAGGQPVDEVVETDIGETEEVQTDVIAADVIEADVIEADIIETNTVDGENDAYGETSDRSSDPDSSDDGTFTSAFPATDQPVAEEADDDAENSGEEVTDWGFEPVGGDTDVSETTPWSLSAANESDSETMFGEADDIDQAASQQPTSEPIEAPTYPGSFDDGESTDDDQPADDDLVGASVPAGEPAPEDASDNEDALARLVREAMQRAVDSARGD